MKFSTRTALVHSLFGVAALAGPIVSTPIGNKRRDLPLVDAVSLEGGIDTDSLLGHAMKLEDFARAGPQFNRAAGSVGHNLTLDYINSTLSATGYYDIVKQDFSFVYYEGSATFSANGVVFQVTDFAFSPPSNGDITADLVQVLNFGCDPVSPPLSSSGPCSDRLVCPCVILIVCGPQLPERLPPRRSY